MELLLAMRHAVPRVAVYNSTHADLSNIGKYADLHNALWRAVVPMKG